MVKVKEDMTGWVMKEHGVPDSKLTVIKQVEDYVAPNGKRKAQYLCECDCNEHNQIVVTSDAIKSGASKSCGCVRREKLKDIGFIDMTGWVMAEHGVPDSRLTVVGRADDYIAPNGTKETRWLCKCNCVSQIEFIANGTHIRNGNTKSCGCLQRERTSQSNINKHKINEYDLSREYGIGWTSNTNKEFYFDLEDYDKIKEYCWMENCQPTGYSCLVSTNRNNNKIIKMHQLILCKNCDHINRNPLDNRKINLRKATHIENSRNRNVGKNNNSGIIGVGWFKPQKWRVRITIDQKEILLGLFDDKNEAIRTRLLAEKEYFGEFAPQKHLFEKYDIK